MTVLNSYKFYTFPKSKGNVRQNMKKSIYESGGYMTFLEQQVMQAHKVSKVQL